MKQTLKYLLRAQHTLCCISVFMLFPIVTKAQKWVQDSIANEQQSKKQREDTQQKIIGTWYYRSTFSHGVSEENKIDSNRVYVFTDKKATVITIVNGKIKKQKHKYYVSSAFGQYSAIVMGVDKDTGHDLILIIYKMSDEEFTFSPQYNDHLRVKFVKGEPFKFKKR